MTLTADELLDLDATSRRTESFRFDLLNSANARVGEIAVDRKSPPSIRLDSAATIPRTLNGMRILPRTRATDDSTLFFAGDVNTVVDRVQVIHVVGGGGVGYENSMGIFLFSDDVEEVASGGTGKLCDLVDQTQITAQVIPISGTAPAGTGVSFLLEYLADYVGLVNHSVEVSPEVLGTSITGLSGRDTWDGLAQKFCALAGFYRPYFDNDGVWTCRSVPTLATAPAEHTYGPGAGTTGRVLAGSITKASGLLRAPNRYIARSTGLDAELVGTFDVPASAPHSFANIGYYRVKSQDIQGAENQAAINASAAAMYAQDTSVFQSTSFSSPIDSRHDTFGILELYDGATAIEHEWGASLRPGGEMTHDARRIYT